MILVYFETTKDGETPDGEYTELVATFNSDDLYYSCFKSLEQEAKDRGMIVTETDTQGEFKIKNI